MNEKIIKSYVLNVVRQGYCIERWSHKIDFDNLTMLVIEDLDLDIKDLEQIQKWVVEIAVPEHIGEIKHYFD